MELTLFQFNIEREHFAVPK